ncbi:cral/trio domain-containing protein [Plakobranchus ocellatus]|uniref:Cral/trio domain-containing protein n=1 Tax=Plakobranchus ocellatus TaxID=259542 RepID=A0AAV3Z5E4_9GAST|nr:cral/trio domain-containing protein [Plakobranchus ocellatus]
MAEKVKSPAFKDDLEDKGEKEEKEEEQEKRLKRMHSMLSHLTRRPFYAGNLDLAPDNLARWLDACDNSVHLAAAWLRASTVERKELDIGAINDPTYTPPIALSKHFGGGICGVDRQGSPVYFVLFGLTDMQGIVQSCTTDQILAYWAFQFETMIKRLKVNQDHKKTPKNQKAVGLLAASSSRSNKQAASQQQASSNQAASSRSKQASRRSASRMKQQQQAASKQASSSRSNKQAEGAQAE